MPEGLVIMRWNERSGVDILYTYPEELEANDMTMIQVYSQHEYSGEAGTINLTVGNTNLISYYSGREKGYYVIIYLSEDEDPDDFEGALVDAAQIILQHIKDESKYSELFPSVFNNLTKVIEYSDEQLLAVLYKDEFKKLIIDRLRTEGMVDKIELKAWLHDKYRRSFIDTDNVLVELIKPGIIKIGSVAGKNVPSEVVFLVNDILLTREPPLHLIKNPAKSGLPEKYLTEYGSLIKSYFSNYTPNPEDNLKMLNLFLDPQVYEILCLLRNKILTRLDLEKLSKTKTEDIDTILIKLIENDIIHSFDKKDDLEYFALLSNFKVNKLFPIYIFNIIKSSYQQKTIANEVLIEYINILEHAFQDFINS